MESKSSTRNQKGLSYGDSQMTHFSKSVAYWSLLKTAIIREHAHLENRCSIWQEAQIDLTLQSSVWDRTE
jgi:hypothetical protein